MAEIIIALIALIIGIAVGFVGAKPWVARKVQKSNTRSYRFSVNGRDYETQEVTMIRRTVSAKRYPELWKGQPGS